MLNGDSNDGVDVNSSKDDMNDYTQEDNDDDNENQNQGGNNHNQVSEDDASYNDHSVYDGDSADSQQNNHDSLGDWDHDPGNEEHEDGNVDESEDNNSHDTNDIKQVEEVTTVRRRNHNISNRRNRQSMVSGLPSANNGTGLNGTYWQIGSYICPTLSAMVVAEQAGV